MSVNPAISDGIPVVVSEDEVFIFNQRDCELSVESGSGYPGQGGMYFGRTGTTHISNLRVVYVESSSTSNFRSFSLPYYCICNWKFNNPYIGSPSWTGDVRPVPSGGLNGIGHFRLTFTNVESLKAFENATLPFLQSSRNLFSRVGQSSQPVIMMLPAKSTEDKVTDSISNKAFVDPSDPFQVHIAVPKQESNEPT